MYWYKEKGKESDVVVSSRVRFARNLEGYPFGGRLSDDDAKKITEQIRSNFENSNDWKYTDFGKLSSTEARSMAEHYDVSPEFADSNKPRGYLKNESTGVGIMICEEDHIRLQCIRSGSALKEAYNSACLIDDEINDKFDIAYDETFGYLTHCPTNLGTGMRASVMLFLPALSMNRKIGVLASNLGKIGLTIRGIWGEGSDGDGYMYQISNQTTLGITEEETIKKLEDVTKQITDLERHAREVMKSDDPDKLTDLAYRSLGTLRSAYLLSSKEFLGLYAYVRLGLALGAYNECKLTFEDLAEMMINVMPATLSLSEGKELDPSERDKKRAEYLRKYLADKV